MAMPSLLTLGKVMERLLPCISEFLLCNTRLLQDPAKKGVIDVTGAVGVGNRNSQIAFNHKHVFSTRFRARETKFSQTANEFPTADPQLHWPQIAYSNRCRRGQVLYGLP